MSIAKLKGKNTDIHLWSPVEEIESEALDQIKNVAALPWAVHVAIMADVHAGKGSTIGSVIGMNRAVSPALVGVDIGCGMGAIKTNLVASDLPDNLEALRADIEAAIPVGFNMHDEPAFKGSSPEGIKREGAELFSDFRTLADPLHDLLGKAKKQVGTLGGGNHFIELCLDTGSDCTWCEGEGYVRNVVFAPQCGYCNGTGKVEPHVWLMLHSGSRNVGKEIAEHHIEIAKKLLHNQEIPDRDLAVFLKDTPEMKAYYNDLMWAQRYAFFNRKVMFELYKGVIEDNFAPVKFDNPILCHHNYVSTETHFGDEMIVTRKGAIRAGKGELGVIPGSMGTKSYIVRGLGNEESLCSASHGAGRRMSRGKAKKAFTQADLEAQTAGVCCRKDLGVLDEIPGAYKAIEKVMEYQRDLVEVVAELKQVLCVKG